MPINIVALEPRGQVQLATNYSLTYIIVFKRRSRRLLGQFFSLRRTHIYPSLIKCTHCTSEVSLDVCMHFCLMPFAFSLNLWPTRPVIFFNKPTRIYSIIDVWRKFHSIFSPISMSQILMAVIQSAKNMYPCQQKGQFSSSSFAPKLNNWDYFGGPSNSWISA